MQWQTGGGSLNFEQRYGKYDRMSNLLRTDSSPTSGGGQLNFDQAYTYDGLNRLKTYKRGDLNNTQNIASPNFMQSWTLDALGNWAGFSQANNSTTINGTVLTSFTQTRTANAANEIGTVNGTSGTGGAFATANYDDAGNQIAGPKGDTPTTPIGYVYDGWNRLVGVDATNNGSLTDAGDVKYAYDGTGRRITKFIDSTNDSTNNAGSTEEYYQNEANQVLEVRAQTVTAGVKSSNTNPKERYLWDLTYVDAPAMIELDTNTDGTRDNRLWATWDISHNVSSLLTDQGNVVEHYVYTPYGQRLILNGVKNYAGTGADADGSEWTVDTNGSDYGMLLGFQGLRLDPESGNWAADARLANPVQGTWTQRDPLDLTESGLVDGYLEGMNLAELNSSNPVRFTDPSGTDVEQKGPYSTAVYDDHKNFLYRYPNDCTVLLTISHNFPLRYPFKKNPRCPNSAVGQMACWGDAANYTYDGPDGKETDYLKEGRIAGFPHMTAPIGPGSFQQNEDWNHKVAGIQAIRDRDGKGLHLNNDPQNYNGGNRPGAQGFRALLEQAWQSAIAQGESFANNPDKKCHCNEITVAVEVWAGAGAPEKDWVDKTYPGFSHLSKTIPVKADK